MSIKLLGYYLQVYYPFVVALREFLQVRVTVSASGGQAGGRASLTYSLSSRHSVGVHRRGHPVLPVGLADGQPAQLSEPMTSSN